MFYRVCKGIVRFVMLFIFRIKTEGKENLPKEGGVIFAVNHKSDFDPVVAAICCPRQLNFMAKSELFKNKFFGALIKKLGAFPVHRDSGDVGAFKAALKILRDDKVMLIFPEGGRVKKGQKRRAKPGVAMIAQKAGVPVLPVLIDGDYKWMNKITVKIGKPISFEEYRSRKLSGDEIQELADNILESIYAQG